MAAKSSNLDPIADVAAAVVADDPALRQRVQGLVSALLADAEHTVQWGSPADRAALMKSIVPNLLRSMQTAGADAHEQAMREAYERIQQTMRGESSGGDG